MPVSTCILSVDMTCLKSSEAGMNIDRELFYKEFVRREDSLLRAPYQPELEFYAAIRTGDTSKMHALLHQPFADKEGLGKLSPDPLQNLKYHLVITAAITARSCIEGGMDLSLAYSLSDFYIQKIDDCRSQQEVSDLHPVLCMDYTRKMRSLRKERIHSVTIAKAVDYIYDHLHTRIKLDTLAAHTKLDPSYLSRLFKKEVGLSVSDYIRSQKIETAKNMLAYSEYTIAEIASVLAFPNQSYFSEVFRKATGMSPHVYRANTFNSIDIGKFEGS